MAEIHLGNVEHMANLSKVGGHISPAGERKELVVLVESIHQLQAGVEIADLGDKLSKPAPPWILRASRM